MHYRENHLTNVVLRLDFESLAPLRETRLGATPEFSNRIADAYPIVVAQPTASLSVNVGPSGSTISQQTTKVQWHHRKIENGTCILVLAPEFVAIQYGRNDYDHFPPFRTEVEIILGVLRDVYQVTVFTRIGLRYINEIKIHDGNPLDWTGLIAPDLITAALACKHTDMDMVRSMHQLHVRRNECLMLFNYGLHNPDYPNNLARREFILDYDCSRVGVTVNETLSAIDNLNDFCETMFEESIQDGLRDRMGIIHDQ